MENEPEKYFNEILMPKLKTLGLSRREIGLVVSSAREQMLSCIYHWNDIKFRKTILFAGEEEGFHYLPAVSRSVRAFVVVTLRNSALETIHSKKQKGNGHISDANMREITSTASKYFRNVDFESLSSNMAKVEYDKYGELARKYPIAWEAFTELACSDNNITVYNPLDPSQISAQGTLYNLPILSSEHYPDKNSKVIVVEDGYSSEINAELSNRLALKIPLLVDGLKTLSRNIEVVLSVAEHLLRNELMLITTNYFISNGYVERRRNLLKPGSNAKEIAENLLNTRGISKAHEMWLKGSAENF